MTFMWTHAGAEPRRADRHGLRAGDEELVAAAWRRAGDVGQCDAADDRRVVVVRQGLTPEAPPMPAPTLFALSSGRPPAAISVIRISGAAAFEAARRLTGQALPPPRTARLRPLRDLASGEALHKALLLLFPGPDSATGDDIAEQIGRAHV